MMRIIIYGLGKRFQNNLELIKKETVVGVCDQMLSESSYEYMGFPIIKLESVLKFEFDFLVVTPIKEKEKIISNLSLSYEIPVEKIICIEQFKGLVEKKPIFPKQDVYSVLTNYGVYGNYKNYFKADKIDEKKTVALIRGYRYQYIQGNEDSVIFVVSHRDYVKPPDGNYVSLWVGKEAQYHLREINELTGDNLSKYNEIINECSALYWIWKNDENPVVGLNHYRRYFESLENPGLPIQMWEIDLILKNFDMVVAKHVWFEIKSVKDQLKTEICEEAYETSYKVLLDIFSNEYSSDEEVFKNVMSGSMFFPCEMFVMKRELLNKYCEWLFPIVFIMIDKIDIKDEWDSYSRRVIGFWIERLFTVWILKNNNKAFELPVLVRDNS